jgi:hypothetical protein
MPELSDDESHPGDGCSNHARLRERRRAGAERRAGNHRRLESSRRKRLRAPLRWSGGRWWRSCSRDGGNSSRCRGEAESPRTSESPMGEVEGSRGPPRFRLEDDLANKRRQREVRTPRARRKGVMAGTVNDGRVILASPPHGVSSPRTKWCELRYRHEIPRRTHVRERCAGCGERVAFRDCNCFTTDFRRYPSGRFSPILRARGNDHHGSTLMWLSPIVCSIGEDRPYILREDPWLRSCGCRCPIP